MFHRSTRSAMLAPPSAVRRFPLLLLALAALWLGVACSDDDETSPESTAASSAAATTSATASTGVGSATAVQFPLTVTDSGGTEVTIEAPPARIISLSPGATEILFAIGAGGQVVAADRFSDYPAETEGLPKLEYSNPDPEAALDHDPELVVMAGRQAEPVQQFRDLGMTVLFVDSAESLDEVYENITMLGQITGHDAEAAAVVAGMRERIDAVVAQIDDIETGPTVFYEISADLYTTGPDTFIGSIIALLKGQNIAEGATSPFPQLTAEAVIEANPEVIMLSDAEFGENAETVAARPGWADVAAVVDGRIYPIDPDLMDRPGPRLADAVEVLARALYPERFP